MFLKFTSDKECLSSPQPDDETTYANMWREHILLDEALKFWLESRTIQLELDAYP